MVHENNKKIPCGGFYLGDGLTMDGNTLKSLGGDYVTPEMYGAVGDGIVNDTDALLSAVNSGYSVIGDRRKTYRCENLSIGSCHIEDLHLVAMEVCDYVIRLNRRQSTVRNIMVDGNSVAKVGIFCKNGGDSNDLAEVTNFAIYNCTQHGVYNTDLRCFWRHGFIGECNVGIYNSASDVKYSDIVVRNAAIAVDGNYYNTIFEGIHYWNKKDYANGSIMFRTTTNGGQSAFFNDCCADTTTYVIDCNGADARLSMNNLSWIINTDYYTPEMEPPAILKQNKGIISISDSIFINSWKDADGNYPVFFPSDRSKLRSVTNSLQNAGFRGNPFDWSTSDISSVSSRAIQMQSSMSGLTIKSAIGTYKERKIVFTFTLPAETYDGETFTLTLLGSDGVTNLLDGTETVEFICGSAAGSSIPIVLLVVNDGGTLRFISPFSQTVSSTRYLRGVLTINR